VGHLLKRGEVSGQDSSVRLPEWNLFWSKGRGAVESQTACFRPGVLAVSGTPAGLTRPVDGLKG
jgi:hypothetical protein